MLRSLRARLLAAFLMPTLLLFAVAGAAGYAASRRILEDELGRSLSSVAAAASAQLSAERLLAIEPGDDVEQTRTYRNVLRQLTEVRDAAGARRVFAVDAQGRVRVDAGGNLPVGTEMPELARDRLELSRVLSGERAASQVLFEGNDGQLYKTGYAPLRQGDQVVGAVGVEGSAGFFGPLESLLRAWAVLAAGGLVLLGVLAVLSARGVARPLLRLRESARRIGRGDLSTPVEPQPTHEINDLAVGLEHMRGELERRDQQLKMMLAGVAHEVRNPIGGMELFAGLLAEELQGVPNVDAREHLGRIRREIDYLKRIVEDFLAFAREQKLARASLQAGELLESARALVQADAEAKGVEVRVEAEPAALEGDGSLLLSALSNLVKNAVQASPERAPVRLSGRADGNRYRFEVSNGGPGIPEEVREKIFEPFFTTRQQGTGLGLPLARKIARAHGGDLLHEPDPERTRFVLLLPLERAG
jgi:signal transduction histidine kinase